MALEPEYGAGYLDPWGYIIHSENITIEQALMESGNEGLENYRRRGFSHTLSVSGHLQFTNTQGTIRDQKDRLVRHIELMKENPNNFDLPISAGFFPSIVSGTPVFEPTNLTFTGGTLIDDLDYEVQFAYKLYPTEDEITIREISVFGINLWDGSGYAVSRSYDRIKEETTTTITVSGSIKCPDVMPWSKAEEYYDAIAALPDIIGLSTRITSLTYDRNYDEQTISYTITGEDKSGTEESLATIHLFGYDWSNHGSFQVTNNLGKVPVDPDSPLSRVIQNSDMPFIETLTYSLGVSAPDNVGFYQVDDPIRQPAVTLLNMYTNARTIRPGQFLEGFRSASSNDGNWIELVDPDFSALWEIVSCDATLDSLNKTLSLTISAKRARDTAIRSTLGFTGSTAFLWDGSNINYNRTTDVTSFIEAIQVDVTAEIICPNSMTPTQARDMIDDMLALPATDTTRYLGYRLVTKTGNFNPVTQIGVFSLVFQKIDIYSFFDNDGIPRTPRPCLWDYNALASISGLQHQIVYGKRASVDENNKTVQELTIEINLKQDPDNYLPGNSTLETTLDQIWTTYVVNANTLGGDLYRLSSSSKSFVAATLEGNISLTFTDDGLGGSGYRYVEFYGMLLSDAKYSIVPAKGRFGDITDGWSDGTFGQWQGLDKVKISLSGRILTRNYQTFVAHTIFQSAEYLEGYLYLAGYLGRVEDLSMNPDPVKETADISVTVTIQPRNAEGELRTPSLSSVNLGAVL